MPSRPAFQDSEGVRYDCSNGEFEGWLTKQSAWLKDWRRRYFILKGSKLFFAKGATSAPHGMIDLATCTTVKSAELKAQKRNALEVSTQTTTFLMVRQRASGFWMNCPDRFAVAKRIAQRFALAEQMPSAPRWQNELPSASRWLSESQIAQRFTQQNTHNHSQYADTEKEKDDWIGSVGRAIVRCSSTYADDGEYNSDDDDDAKDGKSDSESEDEDNPYR